MHLCDINISDKDEPSGPYGQTKTVATSLKLKLPLRCLVCPGKGVAC